MRLLWHLTSWVVRFDAVQGVLNWVGRPAPGKHPPTFEARLYNPLFKSADPVRLGDDWLEDLNPESRVTVSGALGSSPLTTANVGDRSAASPARLLVLCNAGSLHQLTHAPRACRFQLERIGYFCVDKDSSAGRLVLNRTVTLKESTVKATMHLST